ncbi:hypothetical protein DPMN_071291 [Dreissena polymorpha]|uniref:EGF-like domain-containing protein n=1 Tax=Dreissena polymorpha TaxID=45954 RepID=A0A9D4BVN0_DREPO|nr:hypothetical protein DPMN_071291 [Dreissena polymorpha]
MCSNGECNKQSGFCSSCVTGYTGYSCNQTCSTGCLNDTCDQFTGHCTHTCKTGFHGDKCDYFCPPNCQLCTSVNYCSKCEDGFHGNKCEYACPSNCQVCTSMSSCSQCKEGFNGSTCEHNCPDGCSRGKCNSSIYCQYGCQHGYWDRNCDRKCKDNCTACDQITGACLRCFSARYYGGGCDTPCNNNCVNMSCHINGTCTRGCNGNFYGPSCETPCSEHCARFENAFACSSDTGRCMFGCAEGFTGSICMQGETNSTNTMRDVFITVFHVLCEMYKLSFFLSYLWYRSV